MRFLVDECTGPGVADWLEKQGHDVVSIHDDARGATDDEVIHWADREERILITNDLDFGEKVHRENRTHRGLVLMRLDDERSANKISVLDDLLSEYAEQLTDQFTVVTEDGVRFASEQP